MKKIKNIVWLTVFLLITILVAACTASWTKMVTDYHGDKLTVAGSLSDTNRIVIKINDRTVIRDWIFMLNDYVEGYYKEHRVRVDCYREPVADVSRQTICEITMDTEKIGTLVFDVVGIEY